jgi:class 3 adenylate cyclase/anti-sigma regulatory factor (Ser/Thr protein kinase)/GAF domain-containing protein
MANPSRLLFVSTDTANAVKPIQELFNGDVVGAEDTPSVLAVLRQFEHTFTIAVIDSQAVQDDLEELIVYIRSTYPETKLVLRGKVPESEQRRLSILGVALFIPPDMDVTEAMTTIQKLPQNRSIRKNDWEVVVDRSDWVEISMPSQKEYVSRIQDLLDLLERRQDRNLPKSLTQHNAQLSNLGAKIWLPLVVQKQLQGVLVLGEHFVSDTYSPEDLDLLWGIAPHFATGIHNQRLIVETRETNFQLNRKVVELETLYDASLGLSSSLQVEDVIEDLLMLAISMIDARSGCVLIRHPSTRHLNLAHQFGLSDHQAEFLTASAVRRRLNQIQKRTHVSVLPQDWLSETLGFQSGLAVPLSDVGILAVFDKEDRQGIQPFTESDAHLLEMMGQQAGSALSNARLYNDILEVKNYNQNILTSIGNGVITTDLKGRVVQTNAAIRRTFGQDVVPLGKSCAQFFKHVGCQNLATAIRASLQDGKSRQIDGESIPVYGLTLNARIAALRDDADNILGLVIALEDLTEERRIQERFKQYASDQVVDILLSQKKPPELGGEEREATTLFVDIRGSTALLGRVGAQEMVQILNTYFSRLIDIVFHYNGTLDKYTGDGFLVVYGAPISFPDDSERAVKTALAMQKEMVHLNKETGVPLGLGIGITHGPVIAGNIGSLRRMEYTVIGESVNLAARLCDGARADQIWVGKNIYTPLKKKFDFQSLGFKRFKNVDPVEIYDLIGVKGSLKKSSQQVGAPMPKENTPPKLIDLTIPMLPEMELAATKTAEAVGEFMGLSEDKLDEVKLATIEACINAFEHSQSKEQRVAINFAMGDDALTIQISDTGQGFDSDQARQKVEQRRASGESKRGWGLKLMSELMDKVDIRSDENGTVITMVKQR